MAINEDRNRGIVAGLRELASYLEEHPEQTPYNVSVSNWVGAEEFERLAQTYGSCEKKGDDYSLTLRKEFGGEYDWSSYVTFSLQTSRESVCEKKVIRTELVEVKDYENCPTKLVEKEIVKWECKPVLGRVAQ